VPLGAHRPRLAIVSQPWGDVTSGGNKGSLSIWCYEAARRLVRRFDVTICGSLHEGQRAVERCEGITYRRFDVRQDRRLLRFLKRRGRFENVRRPLFASGWFYPGYAIQVARFLRRERYDVAHVLNFPQFASIIRALDRRIRIVLHMRCEWLTQLDRKVIARRLKAVDAVVGCSEYVTGKIRHAFPSLADRCHTVLNAIDTDQFTPAAEIDSSRLVGAGRLLFVGRLSPEKGVHLLLEAFEGVLRRFPQAKLEMIGEKGACPREFIVDLSDDERIRDLGRFYGDGEYWSYLAEVMARPRLAGRVKWLAPRPHAELVRRYQLADVLVHPSLSEAFGMTLLEGMATGLPVVASRLGGMVELVEDGRTGLLVEPGNPRALAEAIRRLLERRSLAQTMGRAGRVRAVRIFSWPRHVSALLQVYEKVLNDRA